MTIATKYNFISEQDYLTGELQSEVRHEFIDGEVYAMAGAHKDHILIFFIIICKIILANPMLPI